MDNAEQDVHKVVCNESPELLVVGLADAVVEPVTMVVEPVAAAVADTAVLGLFVHILLANSAVQFQLAAIKFCRLWLEVSQLAISFQ